jgi:HPt (histidine-containing phosphotransfer) domain-containing protein
MPGNLQSKTAGAKIQSAAMSSRQEPETYPGGPWTLPEELRLLADLDDAETVREVIGVFQTDTEARLARIRLALEGQDLGRARAEAHAIKGSAGQVGAAHVSHLARELETVTGNQDLAAARSLLPELEAAFAAVRRDMNRANF